MQVTFKQIDITGFRSVIASKRFYFDSEGLVLVCGENGAGKTSVFEALFWCLFGQTLKGGAEKSVVTLKQYRPLDFKGTEVTLYYEIDGTAYNVTRTAGSKSTLSLYCNGEATDKLHKKDVQNQIIETLGVNADTFLASVLLGQRMSRFMEASASDKRDIFESMLGLEFVKRGKEAANQRYQELTAKIQARTLNNNNTLERIATIRETIKRIEANNAEITAKVKEQRENHERDLDRCRTELAHHEGELMQLKEVDKPDVQLLAQLQNRTAKLNSDIGGLKVLLTSISRQHDAKLDEIEALEQAGAKCPTCGQPTMTEDQIAKAMTELNFAADALEADHSDARNSKKVAELELTQANETITELRTQERLYTTYLREKAQLETKVENSRNQLQRVEERAAQWDNIVLQGTDGYEQQIVDLQATLNEYDTRELMEELALVDFWRKKGFSSDGIQAYIVKAQLDRLTQIANDYASTMGMTVRADIDITKSRKSFYLVCTRADGHVIDYDALSGGEKARIDISMAFALFDLLGSAKTQFNIMILDEAFTGLDEDGLYGVFEMLRRKSTECCVYVITHKSDIDTLNTRLLEVEKVDGQTNFSSVPL